MRAFLPFTLTLFTSLAAFTAMAFYMEGWFVHSHVATILPARAGRAPAAESAPAGPSRRERAGIPDRRGGRAGTASNESPAEIPDDLIRAGLSALTN